MNIIQDAQNVLQAANFEFPAGYPLVSIEVEEFTELTGDDALRLLVVIDDRVDVEKIKGKEVGEFKAAIRERLLENEIKLFPYVFLAKPSELAEELEEDE